MQENVQLKLMLEHLHKRHVGLTLAFAGTLTESASVCLSRHHGSPVEVDVVCGGSNKSYIAEFQQPDAITLNTYANDIDATEDGAYGICLAAVEAEESLVAVRRAETLTGADWYVAPSGTSPGDLEDCYRLEVSGLDAGNRAAVQARLKQKVEQTRRGANNLPAIASVVGFKVTCYSFL
jgi:hypothetical protein